MPRKTAWFVRSHCTVLSGFNEAAARCRGKPRTSTKAPSRSRCFNEAAARCRGKPGATRADAPGPDGASMRPRPDAAENRTGRAWYAAAQEWLQ